MKILVVAALFKPLLMTIISILAYDEMGAEWLPTRKVIITWFIGAITVDAIVILFIIS